MPADNGSATVAHVDYTAEKPQKYHTLPVHPFHPDRANAALSAYSDTIELFIPKVALKDNARSFVQWNTKTYGGFASYLRPLTQLFGYIANKVPTTRREGETHDPVVVLYSTVHGAREEWRHNEKKARCDEREIAGMRLRVSVQSEMYSIGAIVDGLIYDNSIAPKKQLRIGERLQTGRFASRELEYKSLTRESYVAMCVAYTGDSSLMKDTPSTKLPLWDDANPLNPVNVFSIQQSCAHAERAIRFFEKGVNPNAGVPLMCQLENYTEHIRAEPKTFKVPDTEAFADNQGGGGEDAGGDGEDVGGDGGDPDDIVARAMGDLASDNGNKKKKKKKKRKGARPERDIQITRFPILYKFPREGFDVYRIRVSAIQPWMLGYYNFPHLCKPTIHNSTDPVHWSRAVRPIATINIFARHHAAMDRLVQDFAGTVASTHRTLDRNRDQIGLSKEQLVEWARSQLAFTGCLAAWITEQHRDDAVSHKVMNFHIRLQNIVASVLPLTPMPPDRPLSGPRALSSSPSPSPSQSPPLVRHAASWNMISPVVRHPAK